MPGGGGGGVSEDPRIEAVAREIGYAWEKQPEQMREHWRLMARNYLLASDAVDPLRRLA